MNSPLMMEMAMDPEKEVVELDSNTKPSEEELKKIIERDTIVFSSIGTKLPNGQINFKLPEKAGQYRVTVTAISTDGVYGTHTSTLQIQKPVNASLSYPLFIRQDDQIKLWLTLENNTE